MIRRQAVRAFSTSKFAFNETKLPQQVRDNTLINSSETQQKDLQAISGAPIDLSVNRIVRIFKESKPATQSGTYKTIPWRIDWDIIPRVNRWENDMMGWASSGDYMQGTKMKFKSKEDAIEFASNQGWDYYIQEPHHRHIHPKSYSDNFAHHKGPLKFIITK